jgi:thiamine biosynthesis lipoprotein
MVALSLHTMATRFELVLHGDEPARLRAAGEEALREIERLDRQLSFYGPDSEVSWINSHAAETPVKVEPRLFRLLRRCAELSRLTDRAFDITVGPLMRAWGFAGGSGRFPDPRELETARGAVGMQHVVLDEHGFTIRFDRPGVEIDLGAVGKGYAVERAVDILRESGVRSGLIHGGTSTVYGIGAQPDGKPWRIGIKDPREADRQLEVVELADSCLSVSAVHGKSFAHDGRELGHVIDPRTGEPVEGSRSAAVIGPSPTDSDALSTALLVLGEPGLGLLAERFPGYSGRILSETVRP